jgi:hypothetical protein
MGLQSSREETIHSTLDIALGGKRGNGGMMLDPTREVDWVECILKTAQGGGERDGMIERGIWTFIVVWFDLDWKSTINSNAESFYLCSESEHAALSAGAV